MVISLIFALMSANKEHKCLFCGCRCCCRRQQHLQPQNKHLCSLFADIKAKMSDITILDHIVFSFKAQQTLFRGGSKRAAASHKIFKARNLCANKAAFDVGMYLSRSFWS